MIIHAKMKMADAIHLNYTLIPVICRFGIHLGFGDQSIADICKQLKIDLSFFLEIVNTYHDEDYNSLETEKIIPVCPLIEYLISTHADYVNDKLQMIKNMLGKLESQKDEDKKYIALIEKFFHGYRNELIEHIKQEEEIVFPYILLLEEAIKEKKINKELKKKMQNFSIQQFKDNHDDVEEKLRDMINIMIKYLNPPLNISRYHHIIQDLFELANDVKIHARIEDKMLIPRVEIMEKQIRQQMAGTQ